MTIGEHILLCIFAACVIGSIIHIETRLDRIEMVLEHIARRG